MDDFFYRTPDVEDGGSGRAVCYAEVVAVAMALDGATAAGAGWKGTTLG